MLAFSCFQVDFSLAWKKCCLLVHCKCNRVISMLVHRNSAQNHCIIWKKKKNLKPILRTFSVLYKLETKNAWKQMVESLNIYDESLEILAPYIKCFSSYIFFKNGLSTHLSSHIEIWGSVYTWITNSYFWSFFLSEWIREFGTDMPRLVW